MKLIFVAVLMFGALVNAQKPSPCAAPKEWESRIFESDHTKGEVTHVMGKLSYDGVHERIRIVGESETAGKKSFFDVIMLYKEKTIYTVTFDEKNTSKCTVSDLKEPFQPFVIPDNTTFQSEAYIGSSAEAGAGLLVYIFGGELATGAYLVTVTADDCVPVSEFIDVKQHNQMLHFSYFDVVLGIEDPERFIPPSICHKNAEVVAYSPFSGLMRR